MIDYLISPKAFAISCELNNSQLIVEMLYLKEPFPQAEQIAMYDDNSNVIGSVLIPKTDILIHPNITLNLCH